MSWSMIGLLEMLRWLLLLLVFKVPVVAAMEEDIWCRLVADASEEDSSLTVTKVLKLAQVWRPYGFCVMIFGVIFVCIVLIGAWLTLLILWNLTEEVVWDYCELAATKVLSWLSYWLVLLIMRWKIIFGSMTRDLTWSDPLGFSVAFVALVTWRVVYSVRVESCCWWFSCLKLVCWSLANISFEPKL